MSKAKDRAAELIPDKYQSGLRHLCEPCIERHFFVKGYEQAIQDLTEFISKEKENVGIGLCEYDMGTENGKCEMLNAILEKLKQM